MKKSALLGIGIAALLGCHGNNQDTEQGRDAGTIGAYGTTHDDIPEGVVLTCGNIARLNSHNSVFYACEDDITPALLEELDLIGQVKEYGRNTLEYENTPNYKTYKNCITELPLTAYAIFVAPKYNITPSPIQILIRNPLEFRVQIESPIRISSLQDDFADEETFFNEKGYDTYRMFGSDAYMGFSMEETRNPNLGCDLTPDFVQGTIYGTNKTSILTSKIDVILHEDWHYNIIGVWGKNLDLNLEESIATLIGHVAAIDFAKQVYGEASEITKAAEEILQNWRDASNSINNFYETLQAAYAKNTKEADAIRNAIIEDTRNQGFEINNASIYRYLPYTLHFPLLYRVYLANPDIKSLLNIMRQVPEREAEGVRFLEQYAQEFPNSR